MSKNNSIVISLPERKFLKKKLEEKIGIVIGTDVDCKILIEEMEKEITSETAKKYIYCNKNLDRLFLNADYKEPFNRNNINVLCRFVGCKDWEDFQSKRYNQPDIKEIFENQRKEIRLLLDHNIQNDSGIYLLGWHPAKYSKIKYINNYEFEVIESKNMHKQPEDTFSSPDFSLLSALDDSELPDIRLDDYGCGYFDYQRKERGEVFDDEYFYL